MIVNGLDKQVYIELDIEDELLNKLIGKLLISISENVTIDITELAELYECSYSYSIINEFDYTHDDNETEKWIKTIGILHLSVVGKEILLSSLNTEDTGVFTNIQLKTTNMEGVETYTIMKYLSVDIEEIFELMNTNTSYITVDELTELYSFNIKGEIYAPIATIEIPTNPMII